ncbi:MAG: 50S ribosomal protein L6 [Candidatus Pacearchaeota archaeon]
MKRELYQEIEIPEGVEVEIEGPTLKVKGPEGENQRKFRFRKLDFKKDGGKVIIGYKKASKKEKKLINSIAAHIKNMIEGVQKKFEYKLKICSSHFPMNVEIKDGEITIKNFLGEKIPRKKKVPEGVEVEIDKDVITVKSVSKEKAGLTSARFESMTKIRNKDRRIFQDGIFLTNKAGREI